MSTIRRFTSIDRTVFFPKSAMAILHPRECSLAILTYLFIIISEVGS